VKCECKEQLDSVFTQYKGEKSELIPILQKAQEKFGYLPREVMLEIAKFLQLPESVVFGVSTFYAQFKLTSRGLPATI